MQNELSLGLILFLLSSCSANEPPALERTVSRKDEKVIESSLGVRQADEQNVADANVIFVKGTRAPDGTWTFDVTVEHPDTGWDDYADGWDVVMPDGVVIKKQENDPYTRLLLHPHQNEQPFTRSQSGLLIPESVTEVTVRAHDIVDGWGGREIIVNLTQPQGDGYQIQR